MIGGGGAHTWVLISRSLSRGRGEREQDKGVSDDMTPALVNSVHHIAELKQYHATAACLQAGATAAEKAQHIRVHQELLHVAGCVFAPVQDSTPELAGIPPPVVTLGGAEDLFRGAEEQTD